MPHTITIDVIIPCYNCENTLERAVNSVLAQPQLGMLWLIDDASTDNTLTLANTLKAKNPDKITIEHFAHNGGVARARNWGAMMAQQAEFIAFLDSDDSYQAYVLEAATAIFQNRANVGLIRLPMNYYDIPKRYTSHPKFERAWHLFEMTTATNLIFNRSYFLACGGFPMDSLFKKWGGEDGALGLAAIETAAVAVYSANGVQGVSVNFYGRNDMHAAKLFEAELFGIPPKGMTYSDMQCANNITASIVSRVNRLTKILNAEHKGKLPLNLYMK